MNRLMIGLLNGLQFSLKGFERDFTLSFSNLLNSGFTFEWVREVNFEVQFVTQSSALKWGVSSIPESILASILGLLL